MGLERLNHLAMISIENKIADLNIEEIGIFSYESSKSTIFKINYV